ncbi:SDR family oxidoreductase [Occultella glacieicola]|uniref:SDR family oxidoreductase n=1 Tax=Occultella glacieicola TaxID=2518684 RepID=A0ABY2E7R9_9MICO|nr:SDR family oxidoreductase [Occultella glacieicola]TDE97594.1 SDR family oxidoreductase [Occultella glacieicola]
MSLIAIIGGHGKVALHLSRILVREGHAVTSLIRNPDHGPAVEATGATALVADVENLSATQISESLAGHDAVVWSAGAGGGNPDRTYAVDRDAAIRSMDAAQLVGVLRYVMVSYQGARLDHGVPEDSGFFPYAQAKAAADEHLRGTALDWTIVAPGRLTDDPGTGRIAVGADTGGVAREDVAAVVAQALADPRSVGRTLGFTGGDTPIADAFAGPA